MFEKQRENKPEQPVVEKSGASQESSAPDAIVSSTRTTAVIGSTIIVKGEVSGDENLIIEGKVDGTVNLGSKHVTVGQTGRVKANINAQVVIVEGEVKGDISGKEKVVVSKTGRVQGNIVAPRVTLEDGAKFKGSIDMDPSGSNVVETPVTAIKTAEKTDLRPDDMSSRSVKNSG